MTNEERHIAVLDRMLESMDVYDSIQPTTKRKKAIKAAIKALEQQPFTPQKYGKWIRVTDKSGHLVWECDKCGWQQRFNTNFCPECGAKMQESEVKE